MGKDGYLINLLVEVSPHGEYTVGLFPFKRQHFLYFSLMLRLEPSVLLLKLRFLLFWRNANP